MQGFINFYLLFMTFSYKAFGKNKLANPTVFLARLLRRVWACVLLVRRTQPLLESHQKSSLAWPVIFVRMPNLCSGLLRGDPAPPYLVEVQGSV